MDRRRIGFYLALTLFLGWVLGLATLAWHSGARPQNRPPAPARR